FAPRVREAQIGVLHVVVLDQFHHVFSGRHGTNTLSSAACTAPREAVVRANGSDGVQAGFAGSDPNGFFDIRDEDFSIADPPGLGGATDRVDGFLDHVVAERNLDLSLAGSIDNIFSSEMTLRVTFLD